MLQSLMSGDRRHSQVQVVCLFLSEPQDLLQAAAVPIKHRYTVSIFFCPLVVYTLGPPVQNIELNLRWYISQQQGENLGIQTLLAKAPMSNYQDPSPP